jgi:prephenate dehydratase
VASIAFFGPHGTYTEVAVRSQPDLAVHDLVPADSIPEVLRLVEQGKVDAGMVPIESSIEGSVPVTLDSLAFEHDLLIQREVDLQISLDLCAKPGVKLSDIKTVFAFPIASAQARPWLLKKLPAAGLTAANSNADAALAVSKSRRTDVAAISTAFAAKLYGLRVVSRGVQSNAGAVTRFVLVGRGVPKATGHDKTSIVCFQREDRPGSLLAILSEFASRNINISKLESRPTKQNLGDYCFFIDFDGHIADDLVSDCLRNLSAKQAEVRFLGSYPVAGPEEEQQLRRRAIGRAWSSANKWIDDLRAQVGTATAWDA